VASDHALLWVVVGQEEFGDEVNAKHGDGNEVHDGPEIVARPASRASMIGME